MYKYVYFYVDIVVLVCIFLYNSYVESIFKNKKEQKMKYKAEILAFVNFFKLIILPQLVAVSVIAISEVS